MQEKYLLRKINVIYFSLGYRFIDAPPFIYMFACKYLQSVATSADRQIEKDTGKDCFAYYIQDI